LKQLFLNRATIERFLGLRQREKSIGIVLLREEISRENINDSVVCILCQFVATCDQATETLQKFLDKNSESKIFLDNYEVTALKLLTTAISTIKYRSAVDHNLSLEIH
jgi:hypothetical protein